MTTGRYPLTQTSGGIDTSTEVYHCRLRVGPATIPPHETSPTLRTPPENPQDPPLGRRRDGLALGLGDDGARGETLDSSRCPSRSGSSPRIARPTRFEWASTAEARGLAVIIAAAGGAAHLAGVTAAKTVLPVLGVPMESAALKGMDSLLSTVQMPAGIPVATLLSAAPAPRMRALRGGHPRRPRPAVARRPPPLQERAERQGPRGGRSAGSPPTESAQVRACEGGAAPQQAGTAAQPQHIGRGSGGHAEAAQHGGDPRGLGLNGLTEGGARKIRVLPALLSEGLLPRRRLPMQVAIIVSKGLCGRRRKCPRVAGYYSAPVAELDGDPLLLEGGALIPGSAAATKWRARAERYCGRGAIPKGCCAS